MLLDGDETRQGRMRDEGQLGAHLIDVRRAHGPHGLTVNEHLEKVDGDVAVSTSVATEMRRDRLFLTIQGLT